MDFAVIYNNLPLYFSGMWITIQLLVLSLVAGLTLAFPLALMASSKNFWLRVLPKTYIYCFRGTPLLVQIFLIYHGLAQFDAVRESFLWIIFREAYWCALIAFALNTAAYTAEILRGSIAQTSAGEIEAGRAYGMSNRILYLRVILPSACRRAIPAYGNEMIFMLHGTALAGVITIVDLFGAAKIVNSRYFVPFESFISAGFFYLCLSFLIITGVKYAERHWLRYLKV
ncbi:MAG TPA: ABC transporter permease [Gammaproteobacteria bacterium]|nr:ABC transporter permease [Gammaproteobacteria bacterium]